MTINKDWHKTHKCPKDREGRLKWHLEHAKKCGCRPLTKEFLRKLQL